MRVAILGIGKIGSSLVEQLISDHTIAVFDIDEGRAKNAITSLALPSLPHLRDFDPEILINAVSLQHTIEAFDAAMPYVSSGCVLCDVTSVKGGIPEFYRRTAHRFVSLHPMFGPTFGNLQNLKDENAIVINESDSEGKEVFRKFFQRIGVRVFELSFADHDLMMAYSLTLPFVSSMVFASCVNRRMVPGTTFKKHLDVAEGLLQEDDFLLAEILFNPNSLSQLERISARLSHLWHIIKQKDASEAVRFFNSLRDNLDDR